ncbi:MAG: pyridoxamine 5'-phosphate oxidase family protein [Acidimicrobiia bacterium]
MSIDVPIDELAATAERYDFAYVVTVSDSGRPHLVAVRPTVSGDELSVSVGRTSLANATARPEIALVYPPVEDGGMSLVVDATASSSGEAPGVLRLTATSALLHRPAP